MREGTYQSHVIWRIREELPGCIVLKNDPSYLQGVPDLLILCDEWWGALEVKIRSTAHIQPNQEYYVSLFNGMSFAAFIFPENEDEVFDALQRSFQSRRSTRIS